MYLEFLWVGKTKNVHLAALEQDYLGRLQRFIPCRIRTVRSSAARDPEQARAHEGEAVLSALRPQSRLVLLDERGTMLSSSELARWLREHQQRGTPGLSFLVGGPYGIAEGVRQRADFCLSLSRCTLPHELVRVILLEQIYRAFAIMYGLPYAK